MWNLLIHPTEYSSKIKVIQKTLLTNRIDWFSCEWDDEWRAKTKRNRNNAVYNDECWAQKKCGQIDKGGGGGGVKREKNDRRQHEYQDKKKRPTLCCGVKNKNQTVGKLD